MFKTCRCFAAILKSLQQNLQNHSTNIRQVACHFETHELQESPPEEVLLTKDEALRYLYQMNVIRKMEKVGAKLYMAKKIIGFFHAYAGQEAVAVGIKAALRPDDTVITSYRCHGFAYIMTESLYSIFAEVLGKLDGLCRSKGGSIHLFGKNFYGGNGIVASQVPLGTGLAFAHKYQNNGAISVTLFGDGAANQGQVFESIHSAVKWNLPVIFVCENNSYAMGTPANRVTPSTEYFSRFKYLPGIRFDGMDVLAVREATKFAINRILKGEGPTCLEAVTYRYFGHSMSDPGTTYRTRDEIKAVKKTRDPIQTLAKKILDSNLVSEEEVSKCRKDAKKEVLDALAKAEKSEGPSLDVLTSDVYAKCDEENIRNIMPFNPLKHNRLNVTQ